MTDDLNAETQRRGDEISDAMRLHYLQELLRHCPHAELTFNDDPDVEDKDGMMPLGFILRVEGCEVSKVVAPTLRECIDQEIRAALSASLLDLNALMVGARPEGCFREVAWSKDLPADSGYWWWWNEDEDSAPIVVNIFHGGTDGSYFAPAGQYGWTRYRPVAEMGGYWMKLPDMEAPPRA